MLEICWKMDDGDWIARYRDTPIARVHPEKTPDGTQLQVTLLEWRVPGYWRPGPNEYLVGVEKMLKSTLNAVLEGGRCSTGAKN